MRKFIYIFLGLIIIAMAGWSGFWFYSANLLKNNIIAYIENRPETTVGNVSRAGFGGFPFKIKVELVALRTQNIIDGDDFVLKKAEVTAAIFSPNDVTFSLHSDFLYKFTDDAGNIFASFPVMDGVFKISDWKQGYWDRIDVSGKNVKLHLLVSGSDEVDDGDYNSDISVGDLTFSVVGDPSKAGVSPRYNFNAQNLTFKDLYQDNRMASLGLAMQIADKEVDFGFNVKNYEISTENPSLTALNNQKIENISLKMLLGLNKNLAAVRAAEAGDPILDDLSVMFDLKNFNLRFGASDLAMNGNYKAEKGDFGDATAQLGVVLKGWKEQADKMRENGGLDNMDYLMAENYLNILQKFSDSEDHLDLNFEIKGGNAYLGGKPLIELGI